jgi:mRNA-degrading endonuclease RelE of RelBE toxin-antitoxin system
MNVRLQDRAEVALRSLDPPEQEKVHAAIQVLERNDLGKLRGSQKLRALKLASQERLYSFRVNNMLRLILSASPSQWIVEDIMQHDRLARLF